MSPLPPSEIHRILSSVISHHFGLIGLRVCVRVCVYHLSFQLVDARVRLTLTEAWESLQMYSPRIWDEPVSRRPCGPTFSEDISSRLLISNTSLHLHQIAPRPECSKIDSSPRDTSPHRQHHSYHHRHSPRLFSSRLPPSCPPSTPPSCPLIVSIQPPPGEGIDMNNSASTLSRCWHKRTLLCVPHSAEFRGQQTNKAKQQRGRYATKIQRGFSIIIAVNKGNIWPNVEVIFQPTSTSGNWAHAL